MTTLFANEFEESLPAPLLLAARLLVLVVFVRTALDWGTPEVFLPFLPVLDSVGGVVELAGPLFSLIYLTAGMAVLVGFRPRPATMIFAAAILFDIIACQPCYSNNKLFYGVLLAIIGLHEPENGLFFVRLQLALVYFGAGLNKLLSSDWSSGHYFRYWAGEMLGYRMFLGDGELAGWFASIAGITVIALELGIAAVMLSSHRAWVGMLAALFFQSALLVLTGGAISWSFAMATVAISAAFFTADVFSETQGYATREAVAFVIPARFYLVVVPVLLAIERCFFWTV